MNAIEVGKRIKFFREKLNLKKGTLATRSGISPTYINDLEAGRKCPTVEILSYICNDGLNITLSEFFSEIESSKNQDILSTLSAEQKQLLNNFLNSL